MMKPRLGYLIFGTSRTGSGVLGETLWHTGIAGKPDQYFLDRNIEKYSRRWGVAKFPQFVDALLERATTPNGVFGLRLPVENAAELARRLKQCGAIDEAADWPAAADLFARRLPATRYVWLRRRDKVRQAISKWRVEHGGPIRRRMIGEKRRRVPAPFSFDRIEAIRQQYEDHDRECAAYFETRHLSPLVLYYEDDIESDVVATARRILDYLGIEIPPDLTIAVHREKLADAESDRLVRLFEGRLYT